MSFISDKKARTTVVRAFFFAKKQGQSVKK